MSRTRIPWRIGVLLFALVAGFASAQPEVAPAPRAAVVPQVTEVPRALRDKAKLDPFYQKHVDLDGLPILSSAKVSDAGLLEAAYLIKHMLAERPDVLKEMVKNRCRFVVMA